MKLMVRKDCINELLQHVVELDSKDRYILSEKNQEKNGSRVCKKIVDNLENGGKELC